MARATESTRSTGTAAGRLALLALLAIAACHPRPPSPATATRAAAPLILISIDGFRWDYLERDRPPNLLRLARRGTRAEALIPAFPTKTFPNHYTIVTGLEPDHHGIIANRFHDPLGGRWFRLDDRAAVADASWWGGEPLWVTAERAGLPTAPLFWPGSEAAIGGLRPAYWRPYSRAFTAAERIAQLLAWLDRPPAERPLFLTLYFEDVDDAGHRFGPEAPQTGDAVRAVDRLLGRLLAGLEQRRLLDRAHLLVVSDHGMAATHLERRIVLADYLDLDEVTISGSSPFALLAPAAGRDEAVYDALRHAHPHLQVYRRQEIPAHLRLGTHPRVPAILALADEGWHLLRERSDVERVRRGLGDGVHGGNHGYDRTLASMRGLLVAHGPAIARGRRVAAVENRHLYPLMCRLLGLRPAPNDGDLEAVRELLR
ncbi:MAG: alkaline phosphatase family protein [Acidobacteria bacterium]|nr:MAG: alkaline phosphatase family protein [Acidobacteriota bacterium]